MCYHTGKKISKREYEELLAIAERLGFLSDELVIYKGFDYNTYRIIMAAANKHETEMAKAQWGFLPTYLKTKEDVKKI